MAIPDSEAGPCEADRRLLSLLAELLFLENSRPVHRQLLSGLQRLPSNRFAAIQDAILDKVLARPSLNLAPCMARLLYILHCH